MPLASNTSPDTHPVPSPAFWGTRRGHGRRRGGRRAEKEPRAAVACPTRRVVGLVLCVLVGSLLDAVLTLEHLQRGGARPIPSWRWP